MWSSARLAKLGLLSVALVFCTGMGVLGTRAIERQRYRAPQAPEFRLPNVDSGSLALEDLRGKVSVLLFVDARCPVSNDYVERFNALASRYAGDKRVRVVSIDTHRHPDRTPSIDEMRIQRSVIGQEFPMLMDVGAAVAESYGVSVTPTVVVIDDEGAIRYRGSFDDSRDVRKVKIRYCELAVAQLLSGAPTRTIYTQAFGCDIRQPK